LYIVGQVVTTTLLKMKPLHFYLSGFLFLCGLLFTSHGILAQQSLSGEYNMQSGEVTLTLKLSQQGNTLQGTLMGNNGASFQLSGQVENNIGYGTCTGNEGSVFFEVYADGEDLTLSLVEPDAYGAPDYNQAQYLPFKKTKAAQGGSATGSITGALGLGSAGQEAKGKAGTSVEQDNAPAPAGSGYSGQTGQVTGSMGNQTIAENEVGDASWGLKFGLPRTWVKQVTAAGAVVGHNTIPGMVLVIPHMAKNMQEMQTEMMQGMQEEGSYLRPDGGLQQASQNILSGDYSGISEGTQVKARGYGVLSPNGGGAYLIAVSTPDKLGPELLGAISFMIENVQYFKVDISELIRHFAGSWANYTSNTSTWISFGADGTYSEQYESAYSGNLNDGSGNQTGAWNTASQDSDRGRWTVRGNKEAGTIIVKLSNGKEIIYEYKIHIENGHKYYREYYFNGYLYSKSD